MPAGAPRETSAHLKHALSEYEMHVDELDYDLPEELIAQAPPQVRDGGRLLVMRDGGVVHRRVADLADASPPSLWILNDTRVIPARLRGQRSTGGRAELLLVERETGPGERERWLCLARANKPLLPGTQLEFDGGLSAVIESNLGDGLRRVALRAAGGVGRAVLAVGQLPLPPYIKRPPDSLDADRYQTVFAEQPGAVAAPTAGLHLSEPLLGRLAASGHKSARVTLHVGPGTFAPLRATQLRDHRMHAERYEVPEATAQAIAEARAVGMPVLAVGTTVVRTLEAAAAEHGRVRAGRGRTDIFIYPPYRFSVVDRLLTNFHLPKSTLLALVMAFGGVDAVRAAYQAAIAERYRFFSYGDAMLLERAGP